MVTTIGPIIVSFPVLSLWARKLDGFRTVLPIPSTCRLQSVCCLDKYLVGRDLESNQSQPSQASSCILQTLDARLLQDTFPFDSSARAPRSDMGSCFLRENILGHHMALHTLLKCCPRIQMHFSPSHSTLVCKHAVVSAIRLRRFSARPSALSTLP